MYHHFNKHQLVGLIIVFGRFDLCPRLLFLFLFCIGGTNIVLKQYHF